MKLNDLTGQKFGRLTVLKKAQPYLSTESSQRHTRWLCQCDCGNQVVVIGENMKNGRTKSCGCLRSELSSERYKKINAERWHRKEGKTNNGELV